MVVATTKEGTVDYSVQLVQANVPFEKDMKIFESGVKYFK